MRRDSLARSDGPIWINAPIHPDRVSAAALRRSFLEIDPAGPLQVAVDTPGMAGTSKLLRAIVPNHGRQMAKAEWLSVRQCEATDR